MTEDIKPEVIKKTQDALGQFIKKPVLTEKLLKKPPFRFLHDIITNIIRETGFLKGLYNDTEMTSENVKEREAKILFLQKLVDCLKIVTGKNISARPSKIVAGLEPAKTNELLQVIAYALHKKLDSSSAIDQLQQGTAKSKTKSKEDKKTEQKTKEKSDKAKTTSRSSKSTEQKVSSRKSEETLNKKIRESPRTKTDKVTSNRSKDETKKTKSNSRTEKKDSKIKDSPKTPKSTKEKLSLVTKPDAIREKEVKVEIDTRNEGKEESNEPRNEVISKKLPDTNTEQLAKREENELDSTKIDQENESNTNVQKENVQKLSIEKDNVQKENMQKLSTEKDNINKKESIKVNHEKNAPQEPEVMKSKESSKEAIPPRPKTSLRPPSVRPSSARPGAPRLKDRNEIILPPDELVPMGKVNVIVENFSQHEDDNEETVVMETTVELPVQETLKPTTDMPAEKGHLVEQILEQLGDTAPQESEYKSRVEVDWHTGNERNRAAANKEMEKLRESIQMLTRAANPLGKLMNFLQEDVDSMRSELKMWIGVNEKLSSEIKIMAKINEESIQPLHEQLERLDEDIAKHQEQISDTRANILRNEQKIKMLLMRES